MLYSCKLFKPRGPTSPPSTAALVTHALRHALLVGRCCFLDVRGSQTSTCVQNFAGRHLAQESCPLPSCRFDVLIEFLVLILIASYLGNCVSPVYSRPGSLDGVLTITGWLTTAMMGKQCLRHAFVSQYNPPPPPLISSGV